MLKRSMWVILFCLCLPLIVNAQFEKDYSTRVQLIVSSKGDVKSDLISYISRELRQLQGVTVTDTSPEYVINIIAMESTSSSGVLRGYSLTVLVTMPLKSSVVDELIRQTTDDPFLRTKLRTKLMSVIKNFELRISYDIRTIPPEAVKSECERIVTEFDAQTLEPARKDYQEFYQKYINKK